MVVITGRSSSGGGIRVAIDGESIASVTPTPDPGPDAPWILPGLVDLQVNGYGGFDANGDEVSPDGIEAMAHALAAAGTTTFVPTVITGDHSDMLRSFRAIVAARRGSPVLAASIPFIHVEGPHISHLDGPRGAHDLAQIRPPSIEEFDDWQRAADGLIGMVTLSPHWPGTDSYIHSLVARGVRVSLGHSHATPDQFRAAIDAGARYSTHLGNGIAGMLPRHPNPIWTQLADHRVTAGFIADGHHLPDDALAAMIRSKGIDGSFVVSDSVALAGSAPGTYRAPVGGEVELAPDGRLNVAGTEYLAGAALPLRAAITTLHRCGFNMSEVEQLIAGSPGRIAGAGGTLEPGRRADVLAVRLVDGVSVPTGVWRAGRRLAPQPAGTDNESVTESV